MNPSNKLSSLVIVHGMIVLFIGLVAGIVLIFSLVDAVALWPFPVIDVSIAGSTRGWQAAHVGGILNGVMIAVIALLMNHLSITGRRAQWVAWSMIITGWGNTIFYWAGNFAPNRGLSVADTPYGPGDFAGALAYLGGGGAMFLTFIAIVLVARSAYERYRES